MDLQADGWDISNVLVSDSNNINLGTVGYIEDGGAISNLEDNGGTTGWFTDPFVPPPPPPDDDPELPDPEDECQLCTQENPGSRPNAQDTGYLGYDPCLDSAFETKKGEDPCRSQRPVNRLKNKEQISTYVEVREGIVAVNDELIYDGENIFVDSDKQTVSNKRSVYVTLSNGILVLRAKIHEKIREIQLRETPKGIVAAKKNSNVFAVFPESGKLSAISNTNQKGVQNIFGLSHQSSEVLLSHDEKYAFVLSPGEDEIQRINVVSGKLEKVFRTGSFPSRAVMSNDDRHLFVTQYLDGTVSKINARTGKIEKTIKTVAAPYGIALSKDEKKLYIGDLAARKILVYSLPDFKMLSALDLKNHVPWALGTSKDGKYLYVTGKNSGTLSRIDLASGKFKDYLVGKNPSEFTLTPEEDKAYVVNQLSGSISLVHLESGAVEEIPVGAAPSHLTISTPILKNNSNG